MDLLNCHASMYTLLVTANFAILATTQSPFVCNPPRHCSLHASICCTLLQHLLIMLEASVGAENSFARSLEGVKHLEEGCHKLCHMPCQQLLM